MDSGNGFGKMVFWTAVIPDSDVQVQPGAGKAEMHVHNLPELDYYSPDGNGDLASLGPTWQTGYFDSTVSFDVVWNGPVTRRVKVRDAANGFAGQFNENQATVTWSVNSASGFSFTSNPGNFSTSVPEIPGVNGVTAPLNFFAQVGEERNGVFFPAGEPVLATSLPDDPVQQTLSTEQLQPVLQTAIARWQAAGASAGQVAILNGVQAHIATLPTAQLGEEAGGEIWISPNAAGWGWYLDAAPATSGSPAPASGKMDLQSVVSHELGHVLGLADSLNTQDVMGETLAPGVRRLPTTSDVLATGVEPSAIASAGTAALPAVAFVSSASVDNCDQDIASPMAPSASTPVRDDSAGASSMAASLTPPGLELDTDAWATLTWHDNHQQLAGDVPIADSMTRELLACDDFFARAAGNSW